MMAFRKRLSLCLRGAIMPTWRSASWLLKLMIPITLTVTLMQSYGVLAWMAQYLNPLFSYLGLPGESAVIFISGAMAGTYSGIAAMMSIQLTMRQASILALMIGLCHALPMECAVNNKTGSSFWKMGAIRIIMAFACALLLNNVLPAMDANYIYMGASADSSLTDVLSTWLLSQTKMALMVLFIIYALMIVQQLLEEYSLLPIISYFLSPLMRVFGLPSTVTYMWLVGNVLGISYGSAVMMDMEERGLITREDANNVNYHLIMNHSMLEDTMVFALTGISAILIISVRILFAMVVVWGRRLFRVISPAVS